MALLTRSGRIFWYSGDSYQFRASAMPGNSSRTARPGQAPSTTCTSPCASHLPPYAVTVSST